MGRTARSAKSQKAAKNVPKIRFFARPRPKRNQAELSRRRSRFQFKYSRLHTYRRSTHRQLQLEIVCPALYYIVREILRCCAGRCVAACQRVRSTKGYAAPAKKCSEDVAACSVKIC